MNMEKWLSLDSVSANEKCDNLKGMGVTQLP